jgi:hypothetical protein
MYAAIRRYKISKPEEFTAKVNESFINVIRKVPGFIQYMAIEEGDGWWASVSVFETAQGMAMSDRVAADWVRQNAAKLVRGAPEITEGPVVVK